MIANETTRHQKDIEINYIVHHTTLNNEPNQYCIVIYKRSQNHICKSIQRRRLNA